VVLFVFSAIVSFAFMNRFIINVVSLPVYVKDTHLCVALSVCLSDVVVGCLWVGLSCVWMGK